MTETINKNLYPQTKRAQTREEEDELLDHFLLNELPQLMDKELAKQREILILAYEIYNEKIAELDEGIEPIDPENIDVSNLNYAVAKAVNAMNLNVNYESIRRERALKKELQSLQLNNLG